jgi:hypothetical protein
MSVVRNSPGEVHTHFEFRGWHECRSRSIPKRWCHSQWLQCGGKVTEVVLTSVNELVEEVLRPWKV